MVAKKHLEVIEGKRQLISVNVLYSEDAAKDDFIDHYDIYFDEDNGSGLVGAGVIEEVGDMQKDLKSSSL